MTTAEDPRKRFSRGFGYKMISAQHHLRQHPPSDLFPTSNSSFHHGLPLRTAQLNNQRLNNAPSSSDFDPALYSSSPASTLASSPATVNQDYPESLDYYMPKNHLQNSLAVRAQFANHRSASASASNADAAGYSASAWPASYDGSHLAPQQRSRFPPGTFQHRRNNSDSSVVTPAPSPYSYPDAQILDTDVAQYPSPTGLDFDQYAHSSYAKSLPSATSAGFTETLFDFSPTSHNATDFLLYQRAMSDMAQQHRQQQQQQQQQHGAGANMAGEQPIALPRQASSGDYEEDLRSQMERGKIPKFDRTISDIYQDELYNPNLPTSVATSGSMSQPTSAPVKHEPTMLSPRRDVLSERLQAVNQDHLVAARSPTSAVSRNRSPFQAGSTYSDQPSPVSRQGMTPQNEGAAFADSAQNVPTGTKTVSPKDVSNSLLEYDGPTDDDTTAGFWPSTAYASVPHAPVKQEPDTETPSQQQQVRSQVLQQYPFSRRRPAPADSTAPQFQPSFTSMESTKSEADPTGRTGSPSQSARASLSPPQSARRSATDSARSPGSSARDTASKSLTPTTPVPRPASTASDAGTYTCTYHGCPLRFETPAKLQKHKREGHRQTTPSGSASTTDAGPSSPGLLNSQAGPHRCDRINPSTGKPCHSIFSRPYDLTRHEDTIHNARKPKVRCQLCVEEKTFSRSDALTRHMRVVHPEVDFPGKHKRKGA